MADETLFTTARRVVQYFNIDMRHGGIIAEQTEWAVGILDREIEKERARQRAENGREDQMPERTPPGRPPG